MTSGLLDTSVVVDWHDTVVVAALPDDMAISAITATELAVGPRLAAGRAEAARRQARSSGLGHTSYGALTVHGLRFAGHELAVRCAADGTVEVLESPGGVRVDVV